MSPFKTCRSCSAQISAFGRFCPKCGSQVDTPAQESNISETLNIRILYIMVALLILALLFPPWETPPGTPPEFLGFHFILSPPSPGAVVSRILQTIQLVTIAVGGHVFRLAVSIKKSVRKYLPSGPDGLYSFTRNMRLVSLAFSCFSVA